MVIRIVEEQGGHDWTRVAIDKVFVGAISRYIRKSYKPRGFMEMYPVMWIVEV
jgi:hypothetical protein